MVEKEGGEVIDKNSAEYVYANFLITNHSIEEAREIAEERGLGAIINAIEQIEARQEEIKALNGGAIGAE